MPTKRQCKVVLNAILGHTADHGAPPSLANLVDRTGLSRLIVYDALQLLNLSGVVTWQYGAPRSIRVVGTPPESERQP
jgi:DNA-binding FadR family transcriptional regulator